MATRATDQQRTRRAAGVLPMDEVIEALTEDAFVCLKVMGSEASSATSAQWAVIRQLQALVPDADVTLREHRLS